MFNYGYNLLIDIDEKYYIFWVYRLGVYIIKILEINKIFSCFRNKCLLDSNCFSLGNCFSGRG